MIELGINHNMSGLIWKANMLLVSLLRHDHHEKQFMIWKTLNCARCHKLVKHKLHQIHLHDQYFQAKVTDLILKN